MKVCPKCGSTTYDDSDEFCVKCGAYFADPKKGQQQQPISPMAAALGMSAPQLRPEVPDVVGGTVEAGMDHLMARNFTEAMAQWTSYVRENGEPSEDVYRSMVDAIVGFMVDGARDAQAIKRGGLAELAMELDAEIIPDILDGLQGAVPDDFIPAQVHLLSSESMTLALGSFSVYPDFRDVLDVMEAAIANMDVCKTIILSKEPSDNRDEKAEKTQVAIDCLGLIKAKVLEGISEVGEERMDALADYWSTKANTPYANIVYQIAGMHAQLAMAKDAGRLAKKLLNKGLNIQLDAFKRSYFNVKL